MEGGTAMIGMMVRMKGLPVRPSSNSWSTMDIRANPWQATSTQKKYLRSTKKSEASMGGEVTRMKGHHACPSSNSWTRMEIRENPQQAMSNRRDRYRPTRGSETMMIARMNGPPFRPSGNG
jgi:hypothetical protein